MVKLLGMLSGYALRRMRRGGGATWGLIGGAAWLFGRLLTKPEPEVVYSATLGKGATLGVDDLALGRGAHAKAAAKRKKDQKRRTKDRERRARQAVRDAS